MTKKKIEDLNEEVKKEKAAINSKVTDSEAHSDCDCEDCDFYDLEIVHKKGSFANILSIISKVFGIMFFILGTWNFYEYIKYLTDSAAFASDELVGLICSYFTSILLVSVAFLAIGEGINLLNRMKESLY